MPQLYLPAEHTEADLVLAGQIAELVDSAELYVAWTPEHGQAAPEVVAELREPAPGLGGTLSLLFQAARELWAALRGRELSPRASRPGTSRSCPRRSRPPSPGQRRDPGRLMLRAVRSDLRPMKIGNLIASIVIALWGAGILVSSTLRDDDVGDGAYGTGQRLAIAFAVVMVAVGVRGIVIELRRRAGATA